MVMKVGSGRQIEVLLSYSPGKYYIGFSRLAVKLYRANVLRHSLLFCICFQGLGLKQQCSSLLALLAFFSLTFSPFLVPDQE